MGTLNRLWSWFDHLAAHLSPTESVVLIGLLRHADREGYARPGVVRLAKALSLHERTVRRALRSLEAYGAIICVRPGGGSRSTNVWKIPRRFPDLGLTPGADDRTPGADDRAVIHDRTPESVRGGAGAPRRGQEEEYGTGVFGGSGSQGGHPRPVADVRADCDARGPSGIMRPSGTVSGDPQHISDIPQERNDGSHTGR